MTKLAHRSIAICTILAISSLVGASTAGWIWTFDPNPPSAGNVVTIIVDEAPAFPVKVEIYIEGQLKGSYEITQPGGSADHPMPAGSSGHDYEIRLTGGGTTTSRSGSIT